MKKLLGLISAAVLLSATTAFAGGCEYSRGDCGGGDIYANAYAGGFAGTAMDGHWSGTYADSVGLALSSTDTRPASAAGLAGLTQETGGYAEDRDFVAGSLYMEGWTGAEAEVGRRGEEAATHTTGSGDMYVVADGHESGASGELAGASNQASFAVDTKWGGGSGAEAEQSVVGAASGFSHDRHMASVEVGVAVSSLASAED